MFGRRRERCHTRPQGPDAHFLPDAAIHGVSIKKKGREERYHFAWNLPPHSSGSINGLPKQGKPCPNPSVTNCHNWHSSFYYLQVTYECLVFSLFMLAVLFATDRVIAQKLSDTVLLTLSWYSSLFSFLYFEIIFLSLKAKLLPSAAAAGAVKLVSLGF